MEQILRPTQAIEIAAPAAKIFAASRGDEALAHHGEAIIEAHYRISDFAEFLPATKHQSEVFQFIQRGALLSEVGDMFRGHFQQQKETRRGFHNE